MFVKKRRPGGTSHGYQWTKPGQWVEMPHEHAHELVSIQPDEFTAEPELPRGAKAYVHVDGAVEDDDPLKKPE